MIKVQNQGDGPKGGADINERQNHAHRGGQGAGAATNCHS